MAKRLYIQLYCAKTGESITLPLNPESTDIPNTKDTNTYNILDYGEVGVRGNRKLKRISLSNIFPENNTYFSLLASLVKQLDYKPYNLNETVDMINRWVDNDEIIRVIISGHLNAEFQVENFTQSIKESVESVGYSIELVEYRNPERTEEPFTPKENVLTKLKKRTIDKYIPNQQVMQAGQTIYKLAKLTYGGKWEELAQKNGISNPNLDLGGQIVEMLPL